MSLLPLGDLARVSFPGQKPGLMIMLECYFDDSGTHTASNVVTWGGLMGHARQWMFLDRRWRRLLASPLPGKPPLKQFHLSHCAALDGEFKDYKRAESDRLRFLFRQIIVDANLEAVGYSVVISDYNEYVRGRARTFLGDAEQVAFAGCINRSNTRAEERNEQFLSMTFDDGRMTPALQKVISRVKKQYKGPPHLVSIGSMAVEHLTGLQAADTIATENNWNVRDIVEDNEASPRPHLKSLIERLDNVSGFVLDRRHMFQMKQSLPPKYRTGVIIPND